MSANNYRSSERRGAGSMAWIFVYASIFLVVFEFSEWLLSAYVWGDQQHYSNLWYAINRVPVSEWLYTQTRYLGSSDILYSYAIGIAARTGIDRILFLSLVNSVMVISIAVILKRYKAHPFFWLLIFTNYYLFVVLSSAERLKFAYIFVILSFIVRRVQYKTVLASLSIFFHTQVIVQIVSGVTYYIVANRKAVFNSRWKVAAAIVVAPVIIAGVGYVLYIMAGDTIVDKAEFYGDESRGIFEVFQWAFILLVGVIIFDRKLEFFLSMVPMGALTALYGNRINVATFALFCTIVLINDKTRHPLVSLVMLYMSYKSIGFIFNVLETGQGFE